MTRKPNLWSKRVELQYQAANGNVIKRHDGEWDSFDDIPFFYKNFDQVSADILAKLDSADLSGKFNSGIPYFYRYQSVDDIVD